LIAAIINGELGRITEPRDMTAQDAHAERMERGNLGLLLPLLTFAEQPCGAFLHFGRGFVGKRNGQNASRPDAVLDQLGDAIGDDARFARAGAGQHQKRTVERVDGFALRRIQLRRHRAPNVKNSL
jgi:hypothetical protein